MSGACDAGGGVRSRCPLMPISKLVITDNIFTKLGRMMHLCSIKTFEGLVA